MRYLMCSVLDRLAQEYRGIYLERNENVAARRFTDAVLSGQMEGVKDHARDFALVCVGEFDDETASVSGWTPRVVVEVSSILRSVGPIKVVEDVGVRVGENALEEVNHGAE